MSWGWVMAIIAVVLVAMLVGFAMWLWRLLTDIWAEVVQLGKRSQQVIELLETLDLTPLDRAEELRQRADDLEAEPAGARAGRPGPARRPADVVDEDELDGADEW